MTDPTALPDVTPTMPEKAPDVPLHDRVVSALQDLELAPISDGDGDVAFVAAEHKMFVRCTESERFDVMRVFGQWALADRVPADMETRLNACNDLSLGMNLVKAGIAGGNLVLTVEQILSKQESPKVKISIAVALVTQALPLWHKNVVVKSRGEVSEEERAEGVTAPAPWLSQGRSRGAEEAKRS